jgi:2,4-diketo-3-deoxy-L-fuconate hydrolase
MSFRDSALLPGAFGVGTFAAGADIFTGAVVEDLVHDIRPLLGRNATVKDLLQDWDAAIDSLEERLPGSELGVPIADVRALPPIQPIGQLLCAGANYFRHVEQIVYAWFRNSGDQRSDEELRAFAAEQARSRTSEPFLFPGIASAVSGANDDIVLWGPGEQHDWELELGVVIGKAAHLVSEADAMAHVAGYLMCNDITVRDAMTRPGFPLTDFVASKNRPSYFPTGPVIVPRRFVPDYRRLRISLSVNGELVQDQHVDDIIHGVEGCVSYASHMARLSAGDVVLTGSPAGNAGHHGNRWLRPGDVVESTITGLGVQRNLCVAPPT